MMHLLRAHVKESCLRLYRAWENTQTAITTPLILIPVGIVALIFGEGVSRAFTDLGGGVVIRIMGTAMVVGGCLVLQSILTGNVLNEVTGLTLTALGTAIYGGGVILGLGLHGIVAGMGYLGLTLTLLGRVFLIMRAAARVRNRLGTDDEPC
ncbi:MAG: hypothetical protein ACT4NY_08990 [Pseudonocardiales bacterium]